MEPRRQPPLNYRGRPPLPCTATDSDHNLLNWNSAGDCCSSQRVQQRRGIRHLYHHATRCEPYWQLGMDGRKQHHPQHRVWSAQESTARWVRPLPQTFLEAATRVQPGPTRTAISGSLVALGTIPSAPLLAILNDLWEFNPSTNQWTWMGGSKTVPTAPLNVGKPASTAHWERLLPETSPEAAMALQAGPTAAAISGSLGAWLRCQRQLLAISTTFGSSILPRTNGPGWAEAAR